MNHFDDGFAGKRCLLTGAASGIGRATAPRPATHGAELYLTDRDADGLAGLPWHAAYSASKYGLRGLSEVLRFDLTRHRIGVSVVVPGAMKTSLVQSVQIVGVDREDSRVQRWIRRYGGHAVAPESAAKKMLRGIPGHRFLIYPSRYPRVLPVQAHDVVALQQGVERVNVVFTRMLRPNPRRG